MKYVVTLFLCLFISFQFSSSIIYFIENCHDIDIAIYDQDEEEENSKESKEIKELKSDFIESDPIHFTVSLKNKSTKIAILYVLNKYKVATKIHILPPEQV